VHIDLNADLGEGFGRWTFGDDEALLDVITSANVACGFHAGDPTIMRDVCRMAADRGVAIGAQVGYRDLVGFGRRRMEISPADLTADILYQLGALQAFARAAGTSVSYLKPHGALYNTVVSDHRQAAAVVDAVTTAEAELSILTLPGSLLGQLADQAGIPVVGEGFPDRSYEPDGTLTPRSEAAAVLRDPTEIASRAVQMATARTVAASDGSTIDTPIRSLCVHGDTPGAVIIARRIRDLLTSSGVRLARFS
jgi:UPF0271 protein